jgi:hypothetical protein
LVLISTLSANKDNNAYNDGDGADAGSDADTDPKG